MKSLVPHDANLKLKPFFFFLAGTETMGKALSFRIVGITLSPSHKLGPITELPS